ncbi:hypothetical protein F8271_24920 [Micromonospora sp. ALFpr18c]|uniref:hypothetical protein n=1 Tax=unclassified Micromonospora TaxID=2617518 RepID=UPI00124BA0F9|nr:MULTISPECIES: hypothetical protein [unclassified Micromonospora]KAB1932943.1 hypothetical protein F8271_24920 [Micromonospora sp. ALFpr18c]MDG4756926.1 hypothetical protein [Micromonospora sp. WMMD710]
MIVASLLLILVAVVLLVLGLAGGSSIMLIISIAASLLAAVALVAGARQAAANRATAAPGRPDRRAAGAPRTASQATPGVPYGPPLVEPDVPVQHMPSTVGAGGTGWRQPPEPPADHVSPFDASVDRGTPFVTPADDASPLHRPVSPAPQDEASDPDVSAFEALADEPAAQSITPAEAARVARLPDPVEVVDGRPRYHLARCPHLAGRVPETLPVAEAVELGFTPCALCTPATVLLADVRPI